MIYREGGCMDIHHGMVWVRLEYDAKRQCSSVEIRERKGGRRLAMNGSCGSGAKRFYDRLNVYFFGNE